ncbi:MAG: hypothetical protein ABSB81_05335 [Halobacteriota archaeon]|jgi:hypothetical protein
MRDNTSAAIDMPTIEGIASKPGTPAALVAGVGVVEGLPVAEEDENGA